MEALLQHAGSVGAREALVSARDNHGDQPLHVCCHYNSVALDDLLLAHGAELDARGGHGQTPLIRASQYGALEAVRYLLSAGADPAIRDANGRTALEVVCERGNGEAAGDIRAALQVRSRQLT